MKRIFFAILLISLMAGCSKISDLEKRAISLRSKLQQSCCSFDGTVTADYGDKQYSFRLRCEADNLGNLRFTVLAPDSLAGISGTIDGEGGKLTFDGKSLAFSLLADGQLSPISAPWIFIKTLQGGYLKQYTQEGEYLRLTLDDRYEDGALMLDIWLTKEDVPIQADILYENRRILTLQIENFRIL